jgi:hypothetical protein
MPDNRHLRGYSPNRYHIQPANVLTAGHFFEEPGYNTYAALGLRAFATKAEPHQALFNVCQLLGAERRGQAIKFSRLLSMLASFSCNTLLDSMRALATLKASRFSTWKSRRRPRTAPGLLPTAVARAALRKK